MNEKFSISVNHPCSQNFSDFKPTGDGGYCGSCNKVVIDFTTMNDAEILDYFNNRKNTTCGVFLESQLKTYPVINAHTSKPKTNRFILGIMGFSLLSMLSVNTCYAQDEKGKETVKTQSDKEKQNADAAPDNKPVIIKGTVSDASGPLPGANVVLKGATLSVQTDVDGKFVFPKPLKPGDILVISYLGLEDKEIIIRGKSGNKDYNITLEESPVIMMGEVTTNKVYTAKRTFFQKIKSLFTHE